MMRLILTIIGLAAAAGIFFLYLQPTYASVQTLKHQEEQYNFVIDKAAELQHLKQGLLSRYNAFDPADLDRLHKLLPDHVDNIRLMLDLDKTANAFGMTLQNVSISTPNPTSGTSGDPSTDVIGGGDRKYDSLTLQFTTESTYADYVIFLEGLESSLRLVDLVALNISAGGPSISAGQGFAGATPTGGPRVYQYQITIRTYWLR